MINKELELALDTLWPITYVVGEEEDRIIKDIIEKIEQDVNEAKKRKGNEDIQEYQVYIYRSTCGLCKYEDYKVEPEDKQIKPEQNSVNFAKTLQYIYSNATCDTYSIFILLDIDHYLLGTSDASQNIIRKMKDIIIQRYYDLACLKSIVIISPDLVIPKKLQRYIEVIYYDLPSEEFIETKMKKLLEDYNSTIKDKDKKIKTNVNKAIIRSLKGLTAFEVEQISLASIKQFKEINFHSVEDYKRTILRKTNLLDLLDANICFDQDVGGMENLRDWLIEREGAWTDEGIRLGVPLLKGVLLIGITGCGKSLVARAIATQWGLPLVSFNPSKVFSARVGESENNMLKALKIIESIAPCVVGETKITLDSGQVASIEDLYRNEFRGYVRSFDDNFNITNSKVELITKKTSNDVYKISTSISEIKVTGNHKFPVLEESGELHWKRVDDLTKGEFIVCPRQVKTSKKIKILDYLEDKTRIYSEQLCNDLLKKLKTSCENEYKDKQRRIKSTKYVFKSEIKKYELHVDFSKITKFAVGPGGYADSILEKIPENLSEDFAYSIGLLWADGSIGNKSYWFYDDPLFKGEKYEKNKGSFSNLEMKLHKFFIDFFRREFGVFLSLTKDKVVLYGFPSILMKIMRKIQKDLIETEERYQWAWLSGVLDGDGCVFPGKVNYAAGKHQNNDYLRDILLRVGILTPEYSYESIYRSRKMYVRPINVTSNFLVKLKKNIKSKHPKKFDRIKRLKVNGKCSRFDVIDVKEKLFELILKKRIVKSISNLRNTTIKKREKYVLDISSKTRRVINSCFEDRLVSREKMKEVFTELNDENNWFLKDDFYFSKIKQITKVHGAFDVYDLCLNRNHNFIANRMFTHNCVMFIDEIEKQFAGSQSSTFSDAGTTSRVIGSFLTWYNDTTSPVFVVSTCNSIQYLPPELISRFDDKFFINIPMLGERKKIFEIQLQKHKKGWRDLNLDLDELAQKSVKLTGREIEQVVKSSIHKMYHERKITKEDINLQQKHLLNVLYSKVPIVKTMEEEIKYLIQWVGWDDEKKEGIRANWANKRDVGDDIDKMLEDIRNSESVLKDVRKK